MNKIHCHQVNKSIIKKNKIKSLKKKWKKLKKKLLIE